MKKIDLFKKINAIYSKSIKIIVGDIPMNDNKQTKLKTLQTFTHDKIEKIKKVGLKKSILTMGEPEEKDVLYKEIIKKEKQEAKDLLKEERNARKAAKLLEKEKKATNKKTTTKKKKETPRKTLTKNKKTTDNNIKPKSKKTTTEETKTKKLDIKKKSTKSKKSTSTKRDAKITLYIKDIKKHYGEVDEPFVAIIVKNLGPSIYKKDAELVSCSDPKELDTVRRNFLIKKLGIDASQGVLDAAIQDVCEELKATKIKYRATFYYSLAKKFKKESALS